LVALLAVLSLHSLGAPLTADDYKITVRASAERKYTTFSKEPPHDHGKSYAIISMQNAKLSDTPLAKPVNQVELLRQLRHNLSAYGFHEFKLGTHPEIVLTVLYGRGWLQNPYLDKTMVSADSVGGVPTVTASVEQIIRERTTPGYADKVASANSEKLFIAVYAWEFPAKPTDKPKEVWHTQMLVDDPDTDLNLVSEKMLEAGAANFDHTIEKEESTIWSSKVAEGHVEVGTPTVVEPNKSGK
jgi:hypothetical protein